MKIRVLCLISAFSSLLMGCPFSSETVLLTFPDEVTQETSARFTFESADDSATFRCQLDGAAKVACKSPMDYQVAEGTHVFKVAAVIKGVEDPSPAEYTWTVDLSPPDTTITEGPSNPSTQSQATFKFAATEQGATFRCKLDTAPAGTCVSGRTYKGLQTGDHTFKVFAIDKAGNKDPSPATYTWHVDASGPVVTISSGPEDGSTTGSAVSFTYFTNLAGLTITCKLDGVPVECTPTSAKFGSIAGGRREFEVTATDSFGNSGQDSRAWTVDTAGPTVTITSPIEGESTAPNGRVTYTVPDGVSFQCTLDGVEVPCGAGGSFGWANLSDGEHRVVIIGHDYLGNPGPPASVTFVVNGTPPVVTIGLPLEGSSNTNPVGMSFNVKPPRTGLTYKCKMDLGAWTTCDPPVSYTLSKTSHTFQVYAIDSLGDAGPIAVRHFSVR